MNQPEQPRKTITPLEMMVICGIFVILFLLLGIGFLQLILHSCFGWIHYLARNAEKVQFNSSTILGLLLAGIALFGIVDCLIRSFRTEVPFTKQWQIRNSLMIFPALIVSITAGLAFVGAAHQISWLAEEPEIFDTRFHSHFGRESRNNLKITALAVHGYYEKWNTFPAGGTLLAHGIPGHSWETSLLPYLDQQDLFQAIDLDQSWLSEKNKTPFSKTAFPFVSSLLHGNSEHNASGYALSHYAVNSHVFGPGKTIGFRQITDGDSNTLLAGEAPAEFKPWGDPTNTRDPILGLKTYPTGFGNPVRDDITFFAIADGSVRTLNNKIDPKVLKALSTPDGGENLKDVEW